MLNAIVTAMQSGKEIRLTDEAGKSFVGKVLVLRNEDASGFCWTIKLSTGDSFFIDVRRGRIVVS